jgi:suppressor for copper-sensitivity B
MTKMAKFGVLRYFATGFCAWMLAAGGAAAQTSDASEWARTDQAQVRLVAAGPAAGNAGMLRAGLQFRLEPGWKIYWRSPGDAGLPPRLNWSGSRNFEAADVLWPAPERFELFGFDTFGYGGEIVLPILMKPERMGAPLSLRLALDYLICEKICIPYEAKLALDLPANGGEGSVHGALIDRFIAQVPGDGGAAGLSIERAAWNAGRQPTITVTARSAAGFANPDVFVESSDGGSRSGNSWAGVTFGRPEMVVAEEGKRATLRIPVRGDGAGPDAVGFVGSQVTLTLVDGARAMETTLTLDAGLPAPDPVSVGFLTILGIALLGGLILNLMPCVLPVLSLKLMSFVGHGGAEARQVRRNFVASAVGILASFVALAGALIALKLAGAGIGWGIQFQQPVFLIFMVVILTLFAANLWGWFAIPLPGAVASGAVAMTEQGKPVHSVARSPGDHGGLYRARDRPGAALPARCSGAVSRDASAASRQLDDPAAHRAWHRRRGDGLMADECAGRAVFDERHGDVRSIGGRHAGRAVVRTRRGGKPALAVTGCRRGCRSSRLRCSAPAECASATRGGGCRAQSIGRLEKLRP